MMEVFIGSELPLRHRLDIEFAPGRSEIISVGATAVMPQNTDGMGQIAFKSEGFVDAVGEERSHVDLCLMNPRIVCWVGIEHILFAEQEVIVIMQDNAGRTSDSAYLDPAELAIDNEDVDLPSTESGEQTPTPYSSEILSLTPSTKNTLQPPPL